MTVADTTAAVKKSRHVELYLDEDKIMEFITAGKAIFTVKNAASGGRATYRVEAEGEGAERKYAVAAFTGSDNTHLKGSYTLMGAMDADGTWIARTELDELDELEAHILAKGDTWRKSFMKNVRRYAANGWHLPPKMVKRLGIEKRRYNVAGHITDRVKLAAFPWLWNMLAEGCPLPASIEVWHEGCCARCAKRLTVPASIEMGYGPDCAETLGRHDEWKALDTLLGSDLVAYGEKLAARRADKLVA